MSLCGYNNTERSADRSAAVSHPFPPSHSEPRPPVGWLVTVATATHTAASIGRAKRPSKPAVNNTQMVRRMWKTKMIHFSLCTRRTMTKKSFHADKIRVNLILKLFFVWKWQFGLFWRVIKKIKSTFWWDLVFSFEIFESHTQHQRIHIYERWNRGGGGLVIRDVLHHKDKI